MQDQVLYLFSRSRKAFWVKGTDLPDTQLYGLNHLPDFGFPATSKEFTDIPGGRVLARLLNFRLQHALLFFVTRGYKLTFGPSLIYQMPLRMLFRSRSKYVLLNINLNSMLCKYSGSPLLYRLLTWSLLQLDGIVCLSQYQRRDLILTHSIPEALLTYVPLGVDINYHRQSEGAGRDDFILAVGRDKGRDYATLIATARIMPEHEFVIVCSEHNLRSLGEIPVNVKVLLDLPPAALKGIYQAACLAVLPTAADKSPAGMDCSGQTVLLDLMASGVPVVATERGYLDDYAARGEEIVVVPGGDAEAMKQALVELAEAPEKRARLASAARARVERDFSTRTMAEGLARYFVQVLD